jgi:tetratricopeptide (TPR) repeat protein
MIANEPSKPTGQDVFVSYARKAGTAAAESLRDCLQARGIAAFVDSSNLELGERFPGTLAAAILASRIVVVLASEPYFQSWYCLRELRTALGPYDLALKRVPRDESEIDEALATLVIALPGSDQATNLERLPPRLRNAHWPMAGDTDHLAHLICERLARTQLSLAARLTDLRAFELLRSFEEEAAIPPASRIEGIPQYKRGSYDLSLMDSFVGRADDLERLHFLLSPGRGAESMAAGRAVQLAAAGGFGKTRVALEYLWRYGPRYYPGGLFWIDAEREEDLEEQFYGIWKALQGGKVPELRTLRSDKVDLRELVLETFRNLDPAKPVLCVVDNIPEADNPQPLRHYFPAVGNASVLATGRQSLREPGLSVLELDRLPESASILMLTRDLDNSDSIDRSEWTQIANWVGHLPLAVELLRWAILDSGVEPKSVLAQARSQASTTVELDSLSKVLRGQVPAEFLRGITQTLQVTYRRLDRDSRNAVQILACLAATPIPEELIAAIGTKIMTPQVKATLKSRHLLTGGSKLVYGSMHRIIRDFIQAAGSRNRSNSSSKAVAALMEVLTYERCQRGARDVVVQLCEPHALELYAAGTRTGEAFKGGTQAALSIELGRRAGMLMRHQGRYRESEQLLRAATGAGFYLLNDPEFELATQLEHCRALEEMGDWTAAEEHLNVLLRLGTQLGPDHWINVRAKLCLGRVLTERGAVEKGQKLFESLLEAMDPLPKLREGLGLPPPMSQTVAETLNDLASNLHQQGELEEAERILQTILQYFRRSRGEESIDSLRTEANLATVLREMGGRSRLEQARQLQEEVVAVLERDMGPTHRFTLITRDNLALTLKELGEMQAARQLQELLVPAFEQALGKTHPDTQTARLALAYTCAQMGDLDQAAKLTEEDLSAQGMILTDDQRRELRETIRGLAVSHDT